MMVAMLAVSCSDKDVEQGADAEENIPDGKTQVIMFQDENTKLLCTLHWDENKDGELSYEEALFFCWCNKGFSLILNYCYNLFILLHTFFSQNIFAIVMIEKI
jgi:hypothetical protein